MEYMILSVVAVIGLVVVTLLSMSKRGNQPRSNPKPYPPRKRGE